MPASSLSIDWSRPWFESVRRWGAAIDSLQHLPAHLNALGTPAITASGQAIHFVAPSASSGDIAYEASIAATGAVATRDNHHDLFNGLMWFAYPRIKSALNALQAAALARDGVRGQRGSVRDAATLFDENALIVITENNALMQALVERRWHDALWAKRDEWQRDVRVVVFGHALLEKLLTPYRAITGHVWQVHAPALTDPATLDALVAQNLLQAAESLNTQLFTPLPVLGIPGWCAENASRAFYDDALVFRPKSSGRHVVR